MISNTYFDLYWENPLKTYNKIKKNFHNMFRRLFGGGRAELRLTDPQNVLESGVDIRLIQELLGHEDIATTQIYTHLSLNKIKEVYGSSHPRQKE